MKTLNIGLIGAGVVGRGVVELIKLNSKLLEKRSGVRFNLKTICSRSLKSKQPSWLKGYHLETDYKVVVKDPEVHVIVELIGGTTTAYELINSP